MRLWLLARFGPVSCPHPRGMCANRRKSAPRGPGAHGALSRSVPCTDCDDNISRNILGPAVLCGRCISTRCASPILALRLGLHWLAQGMSLTWESKIKKPAGKKANDTEKSVAKALYDLQLTSDQLKSALKVCDCCWTESTLNSLMSSRQLLRARAGA